MMLPPIVPVALLVRMSRVCCVGTVCVNRDVDLLHEEEGEVARECGLDAVRPLVQEDAVAAADDGAGVVQAEGESEARRETHGARIQQSVAPAGLIRRHVGNRNERQQRSRRWNRSCRSRRSR